MKSGVSSLKGLDTPSERFKGVYGDLVVVFSNPRLQIPDCFSFKTCRTTLSVIMTRESGVFPWSGFVVRKNSWPYKVMAAKPVRIERILYVLVSRVAQWSKALHLSARGVTTDPGSIPGCITTGCDWESHGGNTIGPELSWL
jgi:hypothetical protein